MSSNASKAGSNRITVNLAQAQADLDAIQEITGESITEVVKRSMKLYRLYCESGGPVMIGGVKVVLL